MMRRIIMFCSIIMITILLIGCNIRIGDGILTVSEDGVQYVTEDKSDAGNPNNDIDNNGENSVNDINYTNNKDFSSGQMNESGSGSGSSKKPDADQSGNATENSSSESNIQSDSEIDDLKKIADELMRIGEELWRDISPNESQSQSKSNRDKCDEEVNQNYSELQKKLNHNFYFPECAHLVSIEERDSTLQFVLEKRLNERNTGSNEAFVKEMEAIEDGYVELGGNNVYENFVYYADSYGEVKFYLHGNKRGDTHVYFVHWGNHIEITITYKYP